MKIRIKLIWPVIITFIIAAFLAWQYTAKDKEMLTYESRYSFTETLKKLENELKKREIPIFAEFDHAKNAKEVGMELRPTTVVVFGSPKVGTKLMETNQKIAFDLPLKIVVWEDENGKTQLGFRNISMMAENYGLENNPIVPKMQELMENLVHVAGGIQ